jgi:ribose/xylose/arabinose/galactoside ABC-type transport system permease subunit
MAFRRGRRLFLRYHRLGRAIYAIGGNREAGPGRGLHQ